jgi:hypothetical protein
MCVYVCERGGGGGCVRQLEKVAIVQFLLGAASHKGVEPSPHQLRKGIGPLPRMWRRHLARELDLCIHTQRECVYVYVCKRESVCMCERECVCPCMYV